MSEFKFTLSVGGVGVESDLTKSELRARLLELVDELEMSVLSCRGDSVEIGVSCEAKDPANLEGLEPGAHR